MPDILIIGGGISGTAAAWELAREGHSVTLLEARALAAMASGWTLGGVRQSGRHPAELPLARDAVQMWGGLDEALGAETGYRRRGNLRLARTETEAAVIRALVQEQQALGLDLHYLDGAAAVRATRLIAEGGRVTGAETTDGPIHAGATVVAAGVHSPELLAPLGLALPMQIRVVSVLQTLPLPPLLDQVLGVANADCAGRQEITGRLRVTTGLGPWERPLENWQAEDLHPTAADIAAMGERLSEILPSFREARLARVWGGLIDLTPDALPVLEAPEQAPGLVVAAGFSGHGFGIAPVTGRIVADLALGRPSRHPIGAFRLNRFNRRVAQVDLTLHG